MAKGYPDYFGYSVFPSYGKMIREEIAAVNCPNAATTEIVSIAAKGKTYSGYFTIHFGTGMGVTMSVLGEIDGVQYQTNNVLTDYQYGYTQVQDALLQLTYYSRLGEELGYAIAKDWTFAQTFKLLVTNNTGAAQLANGDFHYALYA